jgi:small subunit ribosomal protein S10
MTSGNPSPKDTYLEYIQRNLPEGVAMKVTTHEMRRLPEAVREQMEEGKQSS